MSVSEFPYPGNERHRPCRLQDIASGITLWWCDLGREDTSLATFAAWLSPEEHARARRYATDALAHRYMRGRAALRWILARELGIAPHEVRIERGRRGRPQLANGARPDFNVSNTDNVVLIGLVTARDAYIGVDVENAGRALNHAGLARKYLTAREFAERESLDADAQRVSFLRSWTCKEAMSKATGDALGAPLRVLDVALTPSPRLRDGPPPYVPADWKLHAAQVPTGFLGTVAVWRPPHRANSTSPAALDNAGTDR